MKTLLLFALCAFTACVQATVHISASDYGIAPGKAFTAEDVNRMMADVRAAKEHVVLGFSNGRYEITPEMCQERTWYISNHDQVNPRRVLFPFEDMQNVSIFGSVSFFNLHGRIIPFAFWDCDNVALRDFTFDYDTPPLTQIDIKAVDPEAGTVTFRPIKGTNAELQGTQLIFSGPDFRNSPNCGILFEADGTIAYRTSDCPFSLNQVTALDNGLYVAAGNRNPAFRRGQHMALRTWERPAPGIVISDSQNVTLENITIHYADGMGVLAQSSNNLTLSLVDIVPNKDRGRFFSTQADATHFSGCGGTITSKSGTYIGMMDDAINVHGTYLKVLRQIDDRTLEAAYMHPQAYGFSWGDPQDAVQFIRPDTMETVAPNRVTNVKAIDLKRFHLTFRDPLPENVVGMGVENLTRTPAVEFSSNKIANNRARGALFSTPKPVDCFGNTFDHVSGCAILLCGDCNGWFETGACTDVNIENNEFIDCLTSPFQFTEAVISICPEIPNLEAQQTPLHRNIRIKNNRFTAFDRPLVYAKSTDGLVIQNNTFTQSKDYEPYHWRKDWLTTEKCLNVQAERPKGLPE